MNEKNILYDGNGRISTITINRSDAMNAINRKILQELEEAVEIVKADPEVLCLIITGAGKAFAAGADMKEMKDLGPDEATAFSKFGSSVMESIASLDRCVIAAVNGYALGGGCEIALACDLRIASENAKFGFPEVGLGVIPGWGGTQRLSRLIGVSKAKELIFTGEPVDANVAKEIGIADRVVPQEKVMEESMKLAHRISSNGPTAIRSAKRAINEGLNVDISSALFLESRIFAASFAAGEAKEGMTAFLEKRDPKWNSPSKES